MAVCCKRPESVPGRKGIQAIASHYPDDGISVTERFDGIDGIGRPVAPQLDVGGIQRGISGNGETQHFPSIRDAGAGRAMGRASGENQRDQPHAEGVPHRAGCVKVTHVYRIESTPKISSHFQRRGSSPPATYPSIARIIRPAHGRVTRPVRHPCKCRARRRTGTPRTAPVRVRPQRRVAPSLFDVTRSHGVDTVSGENRATAEQSPMLPIGKAQFRLVEGELTVHPSRVSIADERRIQ